MGEMGRNGKREAGVFCRGAQIRANRSQSGCGVPANLSTQVHFDARASARRAAEFEQKGRKGREGRRGLLFPLFPTFLFNLRLLLRRAHTQRPPAIPLWSP